METIAFMVLAGVLGNAFFGGPGLSQGLIKAPFRLLLAVVGLLVVYYLAYTRYPSVVVASLIGFLLGAGCRLWSNRLVEPSWEPWPERHVQWSIIAVIALHIVYSGVFIFASIGVSLIDFSRFATLSVGGLVILIGVLSAVYVLFRSRNAEPVIVVSVLSIYFLFAWGIEIASSRTRLISYPGGGTATAVASLLRGASASAVFFFLSVYTGSMSRPRRTISSRSLKAAIRLALQAWLLATISAATWPAIVSIGRFESTAIDETNWVRLAVLWGLCGYLIASIATTGTAARIERDA